jgi:hypothetical protein
MMWTPTFVRDMVVYGIHEKLTYDVTQSTFA